MRICLLLFASLHDLLKNYDTTPPRGHYFSAAMQGDRFSAFHAFTAAVKYDVFATGIACALAARILMI